MKTRHGRDEHIECTILHNFFIVFILKWCIFRIKMLVTIYHEAIIIGKKFAEIRLFCTFGNTNLLKKTDEHKI